MEYSINDIRNLVKRANDIKGIAPARNVPGSIILWGCGAYGMWEVVEIVNAGGGCRSLSGYGTKNETGIFLEGLIRKLSAANKANGKGNIEKALNKIAKNAKAHLNKKLHGVFLSEGLPAACDGFVLIRAFEPFEVGEPAEGIDLANILNPAKQNNDERLQLPTVGELKAYITLKKAEKQKGDPPGIEYDFGENMPLVNAAYLLDMLQVFNEAFYNKSNLASPIYFRGADGEGVLCPIRRQEGKR